MHTLSDLLNSDDAVSEVLGYILIFGMIVTMVSLIFTVAIPSIEDAQASAYLKSIERGITVFDSKASIVALGESPAQTVNIDSKGGIFGVNESASHITVVMGDTDKKIFDDTLGTLTYVLGGIVIAYEGGGVWMKYPKGDAIMLSPPEFHYNGETLTLPIIRLLGNEATSGTGTVQFKVTKDNSTIRFPNSTINTLFINPVAGSKDILITITSDYYKAWAKYMEERTEVHGITTNDTRREVSASLNIKTSDNAYELTNNLNVYDMDNTMPNPITNFKLNLTEDQSGPAHALRVKFITDIAINPQLTIETVWRSGYKIIITYNDNGFIEEWETDMPADLSNMEFDLLSNDFATLKKPSADPKQTLSWGNNQSAYDAGVDYIGSEINPTTLNNVTQHYMSIMPAPFEFEVLQNNGKVDLSISSVVLNYAVAPPGLTYLHIVEHNITVGIS